MVIIEITIEVDEKPIGFKLGKSKTVQAMFQKIEKKTGIKFNDYPKVVLLKGSPLEPERTLSSYGIKNNMVLHFKAAGEQQNVVE